MPENLRTLKGRIRTAKNIAQLAKTLEMVSVSKIRRARTLAETVRPYAERITALTETAMGSLGPEERQHPYLRAPGFRPASSLPSARTRVSAVLSRATSCGSSRNPWTRIRS